MEKKAAYLKESLITYDDTTCFAVNRHTLRAGGECQINGPAVFVFIDGTGFLQSSADTYPCKKGDYFFLPHAAGQVKVSTTSNLQWVECLPSKRS
jgi:mannose-6-phosphate isomerase class I